jgi:hypothetical protein
MAGEAGDVLDDIHRLGGWAVAAHPDSPRPNLRWRAQQMGAVDGVEWLNVDSEWRSHTNVSNRGTALRSTIRGPEAIASLFRAPSPGLARWEQHTAHATRCGARGRGRHARLGADDAASSVGAG